MFALSGAAGELWVEKKARCSCDIGSIKERKTKQEEKENGNCDQKCVGGSAGRGRGCGTGDEYLRGEGQDRGDRTGTGGISGGKGDRRDG